MKNTGFSLVELVCVVALFSIMAAFIIPDIMATRSRMRLRGTAMEMVGDLQLAKIEAIKENSYVVVALVDHGYTIFIDNGEKGGEAADWEHQPNEKVLVAKKVVDSIEIASSFPSSHLRFSGIAGVRAGSIYLRSGQGPGYAICLSRNGRVRLIKET